MPLVQVFMTLKKVSRCFVLFCFEDWCEEKERSSRRSSAEKNTKKSTGYKKKNSKHNFKEKALRSLSSLYCTIFPYSKPRGETEMPSRGTWDSTGRKCQDLPQQAELLKQMILKSCFVI